MKMFTATTLALGLAASGAMADAHMPMNDSADLNAMQGDLIRTRDITGGTIYALAETDTWDNTAPYSEVGADWTAIGEIEDIVLSRDGQMIGIVGEIGGFLDIGDKHVMISISDVSLVAVDDQSYSYVTRLTEEQLEELEGVDEGFWD